MQRQSRARGDHGQATIEQLGILAVVAVVISAVLLAFALSTALVGSGTARLVCQVLTLGTGDCGAPADAADREPDEPCLVAGESDRIRAGIGFTFVQVGADRGFAWEQLSDGRYRVKQTSGGDGGATAGVGATFAFTVADTDVGAGASAGVSGGVRFEGGREWVVDSQADLERLTNAENWDRVDQVVGAVPGGGLLPWVRDKVGIGEQFPPPDRVFVAGGLYGDASAYAGAGAVAKAKASRSQLLGYSYSPAAPQEHTFYYRTTTSGEAAASLGLDGAALKGSVETLTSITVRDGDIVRANRTGLATGSSGGLTNVLFGEDFTTRTGDDVGTGVQYDASLEVAGDADRRAVEALIASAGIDAAGLGISSLDPGGSTDPLAGAFTDRVRDAGDLTRIDVTADDSTPFAGDVSLEAGAVAGINGEYTTRTMQYANPEYYDGTAFAPRTTC